MTAISITPYNNDEDEYPQFELLIKETFSKSIENNEPLFTTDATGLFDIYLLNIPAEARQHYNCNACRLFIDRYGGLVTIGREGGQTSAIWDENVPHFFKNSVLAMKKTVEKAKVNGVFFSKFETLGNSVTGEWTHISVNLPKHRVYREKIKGINEITAEKKADFSILIGGLLEYPVEVVDQALGLLKSESLYRSEKIVGVAEWIKDLHTRRSETKNKKLRDNISWLAVATAPPGFCHIKSTMIGTLLDDIVAGLPFNVVSRRFSEKMSPLQYQRPQAAPTTGNIKKAEEIVAKLGIEKSLERRFARIDEILTMVWRQPEAVKSDENGVFSHLKPKNKRELLKMEIPPVKITWMKFYDNVLPTAKSIEYYVNSVDNFSAILTARHLDAPPIIQWDREELRNPFSHYVYTGNTTAIQWNLASGYTKVTGICHEPSMWSEGFDYHGKAVFFLLEGAKDSRYKTSGNALFPEILKNELRGVRSTIEAYSKNAEIFGYEDASACGIRLQAGLNWDAKIRVTTEYGVATYVLDRWD